MLIFDNEWDFSHMDLKWPLGHFLEFQHYLQHIHDGFC